MPTSDPTGMNAPEPSVAETALNERPTCAAGPPPLSVRERECLQLVATGLRPSQIADRLTLSAVTVNLHLRNARRKLGAVTLPEAVARGLVSGQIDFG